MKKILCLAIALSAIYNLSAQNAGKSLTHEDQVFCDSFNKVFFAAADSFKSIRGSLIPGDDLGGGNGPDYYKPFSRLPGAISTWYFPGYEIFSSDFSSGTDSSQVYQQYSNLIARIGECLQAGAAKSLDHSYTMDPNAPGTLKYTINITALNQGFDARLQDWKIQVLFITDMSHVNDDAGKNYSITVYILPVKRH